MSSERLPVSYGTIDVQTVGYGLGADGYEPLPGGGARFWIGDQHEDRTRQDLEAAVAGGPYCAICRQRHFGKCYGR